VTLEFVSGLIFSVARCISCVQLLKQNNVNNLVPGRNQPCVYIDRLACHTDLSVFDSSTSWQLVCAIDLYMCDDVIVPATGDELYNEHLDDDDDDDDCYRYYWLS